MTSVFNKQATNVKSQAEAFEKAVSAEFEFEEPDDIQQELLEVVAKCLHLKLVASNANRFKFCDLDESNEVALLFGQDKEAALADWKIGKLLLTSKNSRRTARLLPSKALTAVRASSSTR
jgi:hypothetical protein